MKTIIFKHWFYGNIVFIVLFNLLYLGSLLTETPELPYLDYLKVIILLSITFTTVFTYLDYLLLFRFRTNELKKKSRK